MKAKPPAIPCPVYEMKTGAYWLFVQGCKRWISLDAGNTRLHLRNAGLSDGKPGEGLSEVERALFTAQTERWVEFAGPLAGWRQGMHTLPSGQKVLVTCEPEGVFERPRPGACDETLCFLERLVGQEQLNFLLGWMKAAVESLAVGDFRPSQLLCLAGPSGCGKSFAQSLITLLLGGRAARPYRYMVGETAFNADLAAAEHLVIEDDSASTDIRSRRKFGAAIKTLCVNREMSVHAKGKAAVNLTTFRRITASCNDEPENLVIMPPLDESLVDKLILLRCSPAVKDGRALWPKIAAEVRAFRGFLLEMELNAEDTPHLVSERYGVRHFQHPDLVEILRSVSHEQRLLDLIDATVLKEDTESWEGTAEDLEAVLLNSPHRSSAERLFYFPSACGSFLGRLATSRPDRITSRRTAKKRIWRLVV